ncbi:MAG: hypothetical protein K0V04_08595 [Deltaproteobacteria bacterium]|nr:hypothetical protein [Deltaproteobacteria bacterium]
MRIRRLCGTLLVGFGLIACGDDLPDQVTDPPDGNCQAETGCTTSGGDTTGRPDAGTTTTTTTTTTSTTTGTTDDGPATVGIPDECAFTSDCPAGEFCVAEFDESLGPEGKQPNECVTECVGIMDETKWCLDVGACCDPEAECTDRGYCVLPGSSSSDGGSGDDMGTSGTGGSSTG